MIALLVIAGLGSGLHAGEKIDIDKYDIINIIRNAPDFIIKIELDNNKMTNEGINPYKILETFDFNCKSLGFTKNGKGYREEKFPDHQYYYYTKKLKNGVEAVCEESIFKGGAKSMAILVDGND